LYNDILPLVEGRHATGEIAWHIPEMHGTLVAGSDHVDGVEENGHPQDTTGVNEELISNWVLLSPPRVSFCMQECLLLIKKSI
jgi:hypothetical protein